MIALGVTNHFMISLISRKKFMCSTVNLSKAHSEGGQRAQGRANYCCFAKLTCFQTVI